MDHHLRGAPDASTSRAWTSSSCKRLGIWTAPARPDQLGGDRSTRLKTRGARGDDRRRRQVRRPQGRLQVASTRRCATAASPTTARSTSARSTPSRSERAGPGGAPRRASTASWCPAASATAASRARSRPSRYAREQQDPLLRHLPRHADRGDRVRPQRAAAWPGANSHRVRPRPRLPGHRPAARAAADVTDKGGTMRLGAYPCALDEGHPRRRGLRRDEISERHRHRYEVTFRRRTAAAETCRIWAAYSEELIDSLRPGNRHSLKTRPDGTILDGHHRVRVLRDRGVNVDDLPREVVEKED